MTTALDVDSHGALVAQICHDIHITCAMSSHAAHPPSTSEILDVLTLRAGYNTNLVIAGTILLGLAAGVVGVFALLRKRALMSDALSHATLPGIVIAFLIVAESGGQGRSMPVLLTGATITGVLGVLCVHAILRYSRLHEDAAIGIALSVFFGIGIVGLSYVQTNASASSAGINTFIYGQAAAMQPRDVGLMAAIAVTSILATTLLMKEFALVCFNEEFARAIGWRIGAIDFAMMTLVVVVTVAGLQAVGLILVIAMLIIPPVAARFWTDRLWKMIAIAGAFGALSGYLGSSISSLLPRKPAGAVIVLTAGTLFVLSLMLAPNRGLLATAARRARLRIRIAGDHLLEHAHHLGTSAVPTREAERLAQHRGWSPVFLRLVLLSLRASRMLTSREPTLHVTDLGRQRGARVARNHALWEQYLVSHADVAPSHVDWSVDQVEHVLSPELIRELEHELERNQQPVHNTSGTPR